MSKISIVTLVLLGLWWPSAATSAAPAAYETAVIVPGVARSAGAAGSFWRTTLWLYNPSSSDSALRFIYRPGVGSTWSGTGVEVNLQAGRGATYADVLGALFGITDNNAGVLVVQVATGDAVPVVTARTYTSREDGGTYGQFVAPIRPKPARAASTATLAGLAGNTAFRSNLGVVSFDTEIIAATVTVIDPDGAAIGSAIALDVPPGTSIQQNQVDQAAGVSPIDLYTARVGAQGSAFSYASRVDQRTNDPIFVPGDLPPRVTQRIDGVAASPGAAGTFFRTTLVLGNPATAPATLTVGYLPTGSAQAAKTATVEIPPSGTRAWNDVLIELLELESGNGSLLIEGDAVIAWARTYNDTPDGTFGQFIPAFSEFEALAIGTPGYLLGLSDGPATTAARTNVGFFNVDATDATVTLEARSRGGTTLGSKSWTVPAGSALRLNRVLNELGGSNQLDTVTVIVTTAGARVFAWASLVDNKTGDAIFVPVRKG